MEVEEITNLNYLYMVGIIIIFIMVIKQFYSAGIVLGESLYKILT